jgi:hypothetical protein
VTFEVTPQDTFDQIIGSGALTYPWYVTYAVTGVDKSGDVYITGWSVDIEIENPDGDETLAFTVNHRAIVDALDVISTAHLTGVRIEGVSASVFVDAHYLLNSPDYADFDASMADEVLQVMAFGDVVFG